MGDIGSDRGVNSNSKNNLVLENMKKHQMLEKAMRGYPAGTKYHSVLRPTETHDSTGVFYFDGTGSIAESPTGYCVYSLGRDKWAEIIPAEPEKAGLLDGEFAIEVNNEREQSLFIKHFKHAIRPSKENPWPRYMYSHDGFDVRRNVVSCKIIPFADFAAFVGIEVPVYIMDSEDGVPLFGGDKIYIVSGKDNFLFANDCEIIWPHNRYTITNDTVAVFSTKQAAEAFILEANKPKEVIVKLYGSKKATVTEESIIITYGIAAAVELKPSDLEDLIQAYKSL